MDLYEDLPPHGSESQGWLHDILNAPGLRKDDVPLLGALILAAAVVGAALMRKRQWKIERREARRIKREAEALKYQ